MANYPQELAQDAVFQSHTGHITGLWFLPARPLRLNSNEWKNEWVCMFLYSEFKNCGLLVCVSSIRMPNSTVELLFKYLKYAVCMQSDIMCHVVCWDWCLMSVPFECYFSLIFTFPIRSVIDCRQKWTKWRSSYVNIRRNQTIISVWVARGKWIFLCLKS